MIDKISINTQSSIRIEGEKVLYFDPYEIKEPSHDADFVLITHDHYDHFDKESIMNVIKEDTKIIIPDSIAPKVLGLFPSDNIIGVIPNDIYQINGLNLKTIASYNTNKEFHPKTKNYVGYIVTLNDTNIYVAGDTDITEENKQVECDIALVPIGGTYTMDYKEAAELINIINPAYVIPTHYGSIVGTKEDGTKFCDLLAKDINCIILLDK